jgi:hypothetical protein
MGKEYHFGVVATFDEATCRWTFEAMPINGEETPFAEMSWGEVYDPDSGDVANPGWEEAVWQSDDPVEAANYVLLEEAITEANHVLRGHEPITNVKEARTA